MLPLIQKGNFYRKATSIWNKMSICRIDFYDNFPEVRGPTIDIFAKIFAIIPFSNCYCNITISVDKHELIICDRTYQVKVRHLPFGHLTRFAKLTPSYYHNWAWVRVSKQVDFETLKHRNLHDCIYIVSWLKVFIIKLYLNFVKNGKNKEN